MADKLACVLFSGTADRLQAAATLASGAAAMGVETHLFLTYWGVNAFRPAVMAETPPISADYGDMGEMVAKLMAEKQVPPWQEVLATAKEVGDVRIHACAATMDLFDLTKDDLDPMVDDVIGVASFVGLAEGAQLLFI
jgi:peroxiredoxin family protein